VSQAILAEAARTPLTRGAVAELAKRADLDAMAACAPDALDAVGAHAATVLACTLVAGGRKLARSFSRAMLPELEGMMLVGPIVDATDGDRMGLLLDFLDDVRGASWEREVLALLLAAESLGDDEEAPERLLLHARRLARNDLAGDAAVLLGSAALMIGDEDLVDLAKPFVAKAKKGKRVVEDELALAHRSVLDALDDAASRVVGGDYTVRKSGPDVGRNDPCPCGSGKKYKKCCALEPAAASGNATSVAKQIDEATLHPEQARELRASEIAKLTLARVPTRSLHSLYRRSLALRRWLIAESVLDELGKRTDRKGEMDPYRLELLDAALAARDGAFAEKVLEKIGRDKVPPALTLDVACVRGEATIASIEQAAIHAIETENEGIDAIELALVLLRNFPALGIYVARGALHEGRADDSTTLLQAMEDARDRLLAQPFEPWWELYDALVLDAKERKKARAKDEQQAALQVELRRARAESRGASAEAEKLRRRLEELDASLAARATPTAAPTSSKPDASVDVDQIEEERRRLRGKVDELRRIIDEGQDERRELRRKLTEKVEPVVAAVAAAAEPAPERDDDGASFEGGVDERPRGILVPVFSDRAAKSVAELGGATGEAALALVAALAGCRENAWGGVKRLTKVRSVYSARAGIHHRILFGIDERTLRVHEVIHRRDLEQAVNRLVRA
jgi:hypothetical protein